MQTHPISGSSSRFSSALAPDAIGAHVQRPHRILIAEDDVFVGVQYEDVLTDAGYHIIDIVPSAQEAVEAALDHNPELVIMDVRLAGSRDGVEAALEIFKRFGIRSIFATAYSDPEIHARAQAAHPFAWLVKPVAPHKLLSSVQAAFEQLEDGNESGTKS
jgi:AmiR/NasT family two-component response regulator